MPTYRPYFFRPRNPKKTFFWPYLEQQLVLGDALDGLEEVGPQRELVAQAALALLEEGVRVPDPHTQGLGPGLVLAVLAVQLEVVLLLNKRINHTNMFKSIVLNIN